MAQLFCSLDPRSFHALLNGLIKRKYYNQLEFTNEFLTEQLYSSGDLDESEILNEIKCFDDFLGAAARENVEPARLGEIAKSRNLPADLLKIIVAVWTKERQKINQTLQKLTTWNNSMDKLAWRVDVRTMSKNVSEINEPIAFFEFATSKSNGKCSNGVADVAQFEMNRDEVGDVLKSLAEIQKKIEEVS